MALTFGSTSLADVDKSDGPGFKVDLPFFPIDVAEEDAAAPFNANPNNGYTTLQNALAYGFGRFVDNGFTTRPRLGNFDTGSGAGNSGATYTNRSGVPPVVAGGGGAVAGVSPLLLIGGAAVLGLLLLRG